VAEPAPAESAARTLLTAVLVSLVCSLLVATAVTALRPIQQRHLSVEGQRRRVLAAAGLLGPGRAGEAAVDAEVEARVVDLATGAYADGIDPVDFDARRAARDPDTSVAIPPALDVAGIERRARHAVVYLVSRGGALDAVVLPVYGQGLYSTLYGYLALAPDLDTVRGLLFYEHGETPGLGAEIETPAWQAQWPGKRAFDAGGRPAIRVVKDRAGTAYEVDGITGATLTGDGVTNLLHYWLGAHGFGPYLRRLGAAEDTP
jgi:Na+-transporting NADH:ubiquinone oxidoreductase subunit C